MVRKLPISVDPHKKSSFVTVSIIWGTVDMILISIKH